MSNNSINLGSQTLTYLYRSEARAKYFNRLLSQLLPYGIYEGGSLVRANNYQIGIQPLVCLISSNEETDLNISLRVETQASQTISLESPSNPGYVNTSKPYIVLRFGWADVENNYMDMLAVAFSDNPLQTDENYILPNDLIVGKVLFEEDTPGNYIIKSVSPFDYTRRSNAFIPDSILAFRELRVQASENNQRKVYVTSGSINTSQGRKEVVGGDYPSTGVINDTTSQGRIDLVYVDENGLIQIQEGTPSASPVAPSYLNRKVLCEITRGANRNSILGTDIRQVNVTRQGMITAEDFPITDAGDYYTDKNIEDALQEVFEFANAILGDSGSVSDGSVKDYHIDWGTGTDQVSAEDVPIVDANSRYTGTEVETALQEIAGAGRTTENIKQNADNISTNASNLSTHTGTDANSASVHGLKINTDMTGTTEVPNTDAIKEHLRTSSLNTWQSDVSYSQYGAIVRFGIPYRSVQNSNLNHDPSADPDEIWWEVVGGGAGASITEWKAGENITAGMVLASEKAGSAVAEKTQILCIGESSGNLDGVYFDITHPSASYRVWFDTDNLSSAPTAGGRTLLEVDIATNDSASTVANALYTALGTTGNFVLSLSQENVYATNNTAGEVDPSVDGDTLFTFVQLQDGRNATTGNKAVIADKRYEDRIEVIGIAMADTLSGNNVDVQKIALFEDTNSYLNFSDIGASCYLGNSGAMIQDTSLIEKEEYRIFLGHAKTASSIDILIGEAELNDYSPDYLSSLPVGAIMDWPYEWIPNGFNKADGREIVRADYSEYMDKVGTKWGTGDGSTTANLPKFGRIKKITGLSTYTIQDDDYEEIFKVDTTGQSSVDIIIPESKYNLEEEINITKINDGGGQALVKTQGSDLIEGALATVPLTNKYDNLKLISESDNNYEVLEFPKGHTNTIINPKMEIWQRKTSFTSILSGDYAADKIVYEAVTSAAININQSTDVPNSSFNNSLKVSVSTADASIAPTDIAQIAYRMEGFDFRQYINELGVLGFYAKVVNIPGTYCVHFKNGGNDRAFIREVDLTTAWKFITVPAVLFNDLGGTWNFTNGEGLSIGIVLAGGTTYQASPNVWQSGNYTCTSNQVNFLGSTSNELYITGLCMNVGIKPVMFYDYSIEQDTRRAKRYLEKSWNVDQAIGTDTLAGSATAYAIGTSTGAVSMYVNMEVEKRTSPSVTLYNPVTGSTGTMRRSDGANIAAGTNYLNRKSFRIYNSATTTNLSYHYANWAAHADL